MKGPDRTAVRRLTSAPEAGVLAALTERLELGPTARAAIGREALALVEAVRRQGQPGLLEGFLAEYGLDSAEGLALMSLAEALLRVPDRRTVDALIADRIGAAHWSGHEGHGASPLVGFSTVALGLTAGVLSPAEHEALAPLHSAVRRLGEPVIRTAIGQAMKLLGSQFVFGRTIEEAVRLAPRMEREGYRFSYDMLGEAARTAADARHYAEAYSGAIAAIAARAPGAGVRGNPGISVKLSALHPRYEFAQHERVLTELVATTRELARAAARADIGFNIDAEEQARLDLSLDVIAAVLEDRELEGWDGFGVVVQAYGRRAAPLIDWLDALAESLGRRIMVRLVKGAYWDSEIKLAQALGHTDFPVFTRKAATDVSYIACAARLLDSGRIYPQFATHNAHSAAALLHLARAAGQSPADFEFQRLHGMGEGLHEALRKRHGTVSRIYAPVGAHRDLLAYLVRRLMENGAGASFVHQIADPNVPAAEIVADPIERIKALGTAVANSAINPPAEIFEPLRANSRGWDLSDPVVIDRLEAERRPFHTHRWSAGPMLAGHVEGLAPREAVCPADPDDTIGTVIEASPADVEGAVAAAGPAFRHWSGRPVSERSAILRRAADIYEANAPEFFALLAREGGRTLPDAVSEVREASDFLRYYAAEAERQPPGRKARGVFACISPWNFPLAIFTGQIAAALAAGNAVIAKPAEATPLIAARATALLHEVGVPADVLQLLPGQGATIGAALTADSRLAGVCFTGSLETARAIERAMAPNLLPEAPLIAETGGVNAMIVDSTALPEQAVRDIVGSAFQSAGQRCSALRVLYVQEEAAARSLAMLKGAMDELRLGDPWLLSTDIGPVITAEARDELEAYIARRAAEGRLLHRGVAPPGGNFVAPALIGVSGIEDIPGEVFGPVLHVARYRAADFDTVIAAINASGFGLTFAIQSRIAARIDHATACVHAGNIYVNRNQIGAVVASQPFGGEGLSGTGPKAGGPHYLPRFLEPETPHQGADLLPGRAVTLAELQKAIAAAGRPDDRLFEARDMPGPTGESNRLALAPRGLVLCLGPRPADIVAQIELARRHGNTFVAIAPGTAPVSTTCLDGRLPRGMLSEIAGIDAVASFAGPEDLRALRIALSRREGPIVPLVSRPEEAARLSVERHVCVDLTAVGGNAELIASASA